MRLLTVVFALLPLAGCVLEDDLEAECEEMCTFMHECDMEVDECLNKCTANVAHSDECRGIYEDSIDCATRADQTCDGFDSCVAVQDIPGRYERAECPE